MPVPRWFFPVLFTAFMGGLFGDFVRDFAVRLRELLGRVILSRRCCLWCSFQIRSESEREGYTDHMSQELIGIIIAAIALAAIIVPTIRELRKDITALGEREAITGRATDS